MANSRKLGDLRLRPVSKAIGLAAVAVYEPPYVLGNDWFGGAIARKFVHHTGIQARPVSWDDEVTMGVRAVEKLQRETGCDLRDCAAIAFVSPSFVPMSVARRHLDRTHRRQERLELAGRRLADELDLPGCPVFAMNWFCSGYAKAIAIVRRRLADMVGLRSNQFILLVNSSRISRITDYGNLQTAPLFGDMATVTLLSRLDSVKYPVHFKVRYAFAEKAPAAGVFFDFEMRANVLAPSEDGGRAHEEQRLVYNLDGLGIADAAPRAMSNAVAKALKAKGIAADAIRYVVPHQAGTGIVRLATMKLEQLGVRGEVVNGLTARVGNVSSCSIPFALHQRWSQLEGLIACPTAAVGDPGKAEVSQGCVLLESTSVHRRVAIAS